MRRQAISKRVARFGDGWHVALPTFARVRATPERLERLMDAALESVLDQRTFR